MPAYTYRAKDSSGKVVTGTIIAETEKEVLFSLDKQGLFPVELKGGGAAGSEKRRVERRVKSSDIINFTRELADLLKAGLSLDRALGVIEENTHNMRFGELVETLRKEVSQGNALSGALAKHPRYFPAFYVGMIRAAETGGFLEEALARIAGFQEKDEELKSRIRTALAYPILLLCVGTIAVVFLLVYFIPQFSKVFQDFGADLPTMTRMLIGFSYFLRDFGIFIVMGLVVVGGVFRRFSKTEAGGRFFAGAVLGTPVLGEVIRKRAIARFSRTLGTMLKSGVPILESLHTARDSMGNMLLAQEIDEAATAVKRGEKLGQILGRTRYFPPMLASMITVGEESGNLDNVLIHIADTYEVQVDRAVKVFVSLFEPLLLVLMAALVGVVVISMLLPVFTLSTIVK
jgi:type II secretory pathway component PulF